MSDLDVKRPKLEPQPSTNSVCSNSSGGSQPGGSQPGGDVHSSRLRVESSTSNPGSWMNPDKQHSDLQPNGPPGRLRRSPPTSPGNLPPGPILLGYTETLHDTRQTLAWRDSTRDEQHQLPGINSVGEIRTSLAGPHSNDPLNGAGSRQHGHRTGSSVPPPPLLTRESTNRSTGSSNYGYSTPRTPMEPLEPIPIPYYPKTAMFENQLAPIQPAVLSPSVTHSNTQLSPNGKTILESRFLSHSLKSSCRHTPKLGVSPVHGPHPWVPTYLSTSSIHQ